MATAHERQPPDHQPALHLRLSRRASFMIGLRSAKALYKSKRGAAPSVPRDRGFRQVVCCHRRHPSCRHNQCPAADADANAIAPPCTCMDDVVWTRVDVRAKPRFHIFVPAISGCQCVHAAWMQSQSAFLNAPISAKSRAYTISANISASAF